MRGLEGIRGCIIVRVKGEGIREGLEGSPRPKVGMLAVFWSF